MKKNWVDVLMGSQIKTGENSAVRAQLTETVNKKVTGIIYIRKWARYCTAVDKMAGRTKKEAEFRPTKEALSFPASTLPQLIAELEMIYNYAVENGMTEYNPSLIPPEDILSN